MVVSEIYDTVAGPGQHLARLEKKTLVCLMIVHNSIKE